MPEMKVFNTVDELLDKAQADGISVADLSAAVNARAHKYSATKFQRIAVGSELYLEAKERGITLTQLLEERDPSEKYPGCRLSAFERQLAARNLQVAGVNAVTLEEFYNNPENRVLFPEFINQQVQIGLKMGRHTLKAEDVTAIYTEIDSGVYQAAILDMDSDLRMKLTAQGAELPKATITIGDKSITLRKHGIQIRQTYEHMRRLRANKMAVALQLVGWYMALDKAEDAVDILINGNTGNSNPAFSFSAAGLDYPNMIDFWAEFDPYESNVIVVPKAGLTGILKLAEFKHPDIGGSFQRSGELVTPFGNTLKRHDNSDSSVLSDKVLGVDNRFALEMVTERGGSFTESDKIISSQWDVLTISTVVGFAKFIADAAGVWDYSA